MSNIDKDEKMLDKLFEDFDEVEKNKSNSGNNNSEVVIIKNKKIKLIIFIFVIILILWGYYIFMWNWKNTSISNIDNSKVSNSENIDNFQNDYNNEDVWIDNDIEKSIDTDYSTNLKKKYNKIYTLFMDKSWITTENTTFTNFWWDENIELLSEWWLKISYPKWSYKPSASPRWWAGFIFHMWEDYNTLKLSYELEFAENFKFVKWWKLPWLCWGDCARGWESTDNGFSVNFIWDKNWYLDTLSKIPWASKYWDNSWEKIFKFTAWNKYEITQEIILNTPWKKDWYIAVYVEGKKMYEKSNVVFRNNENININSVLFSTFFWWNDISWATPSNTYINFKNFRINK